MADDKLTGGADTLPVFLSFRFTLAGVFSSFHVCLVWFEMDCLFFFG